MPIDRTTTVIDLIRHGEPEGGPMFRGSKDDPLSALGWQQMEKAIGNNNCWDVILSSPMQRCRHFADRLAERLGLPLHTDERLREISFGEWEGLTASEIEARYGERLALFWADAEANPPPGGELLSQFQARVLAAWEEWTGELAGKHILLVCHGGVIRVALGEIMGIPRERTLSAVAVPYAWCSRVRLDRTEHGTLDCLMSHSPGIIPVG